ncbi:MspA family porin [Gordonia sp. VNK21]|uniref:MspA family porin n=1 Tax=Gordonia sp. VNK21 TaxID=3382483 RepID=UPI0038D4F2B3
MTTIKSRVLAGTALASAAVIGLTGVGAGAANAGKLPGVTKTKNLGEAGSVTIKLTDQSVRITRAVTNVPTSREVWLSGKVKVGTSGEVKGGNVAVGYLVGCQLNFGAGGGLDGTFDSTDPDASSGDTTAGPSGSFSLSPGEAKYVSVIKLGEIDSFNFTNARGGVAYSQERFGVDGCAGYAEAMPKVTVQVSTDTFKGNVTAYGKPFSIG